MRQCPKCGKRFLADHERVCDRDGSDLQAVVLSSARDRLVGAVVLDRYHVDGVLGDGGMGVVYRARDSVSNRRFAIKVLRAEYTTDDDLVTRFRQEAEAVQDIKHPNIVEVYEFGTLPDQSRFFVMEYLEGRSLGQALTAQPRKKGRDRRMPLPEGMIVRIAAQICAGLAAAHAKGVVHRDLKPDNIHLIRRDDEELFVKILDFGIAKVQGSKSARTRTGSVFGTPHYMAPEQASGERDIDLRTDVYALGVLMYEMSTGRVPFDSENLMGILTAHLYHAPVPPRSHPEGSDLSPGLEAVILKAMAKPRDARYRTMDLFREDLQRLERGEEPLALTDPDERTGVYSLPPPPPGALAINAATGNDNQTVPEGRISRVSPSGKVSAIDLDDAALDAPTSVADGGLGVVPVGTARSIPPVTAATSRGRTRGTIIAATLGAGGALAVALVAVLAMKRGEARSSGRPLRQSTVPAVVVEPTALPVATSVALPLPGSLPAPGTALAPPAALSETITVASDPPGAQVMLGRQRVGVTPFAVPRPASGDVTYTLVADGRMRMPVTVRPTTASQIEVPLPAASAGTRPPATGGGGSGTHAPRQQDILNPWANER